MSKRLIDIAEDSARGGFFLFTGNASSLIILAVGSIVVARLLGPENYGLLALSLVVPSMLAGFTDLGISLALTRFPAKYRAEGENGLAACVLRSGFTFKLVLGISTSLVCFAFADVFAAYVLNRPGIGYLIRVGSILVLLQTILVALTSSFMGLDRMEGCAFVMNAQAVAKTIASPLLVALGFSVIGALTGHVLGYAIAILSGLPLLLKYYRGLGRPCKDGFGGSIKAMLTYGFPLYFSAILAYFLGQCQTLILAFFASNVEIGNFNVAVTLSTAMSVLTFPLGVLFPAFSKLNPDSEELRRLFRLSVKYTAILIVPASIGMAVLSRDLVYLIYGRSYWLAPLFLSLYALTFLYAGLGSLVLTHFFSGIGETKVVFKSNLINLFAFLPFAYALTMLYRVPGLIIALLVSGIFPLSYSLFIAKKKFQAGFDAKASLKIYLASSLSALLTFTFIHLYHQSSFINVVVGVPIFLIAYLTLLPLVRGVSEQDLDNFELIFGKNRVLKPIIKSLRAYEDELLRLAKSM